MLAVDPARLLAETDDLELLRRAAHEAGQIALRYFRQSPEVWLKAGQSPVSEADYAVDRFLTDTLRQARPDYGWLSEETIDTPARLSHRRVFVVDPIDGTRGFLEGRRAWCVSIAVVEDGVAIAGVLECPAAEETFWAETGAGAWRNNQRIHVREPRREFDVAASKSFVDALPEALRVRVRRAAHVPSLAYRIALIAAGKLDATFVKPNSHDWDLAAADLILREAGGAILRADRQAPVYGGPDPTQGALVAGREPFLSKFAAALARLDA